MHQDRNQPRRRPLPGRHARAGATLLAIALCTPGLADDTRGLEPAEPWRADQGRFRPVDPGRQDTGPMAESLRLLPFDLRHPTGFDQVYRVPGQEGMFMRMDGGLTAIFPKGVYSQTPFGDLPEVPPGTVFHIGTPPGTPWSAPGLGLDLDDPGRALPNRIDTRIRLTGGHPTELRLRRTLDNGDDGRSPSFTMWNNERVRQDRVGHLIRRAADTAATRQ